MGEEAGRSLRKEDSVFIVFVAAIANHAAKLPEYLQLLQQRVISDFVNLITEVFAEVAEQRAVL